jgi:hypothetical protein
MPIQTSPSNPDDRSFTFGTDRYDTEAYFLVQPLPPFFILKTAALAGFDLTTHKLQPQVETMPLNHSARAVARFIIFFHYPN